MVEQRLEAYLNEETEKLDHWREDAEAAFKRELDDLRKEIATKEETARGLPQPEGEAGHQEGGRGAESEGDGAQANAFRPPGGDRP